MHNETRQGRHVLIIHIPQKHNQYLYNELMHLCFENKM